MKTDIVLQNLLDEVRGCTYCEKLLPQAPRPVLRLAASARVLIIGQAPGSRVHASGIPWDDPSGDRLREWLGLNKEQFYDEGLIAIVPMGLCYPGRGKSGDLPPRPECAPRWHDKLFAHLPMIELVLLVGRYAQSYYGTDNRRTVAETIQRSNWRLDKRLPLVHPSPRNRHWLRKHPWFEQQLVPILKHRIQKVVGAG